MDQLKKNLKSMNLSDYEMGVTVGTGNAYNLIIKVLSVEFVLPKTKRENILQ